MEKVDLLKEIDNIRSKKTSLERDVSLLKKEKERISYEVRKEKCHMGRLSGESHLLRDAEHVSRIH